MEDTEEYINPDNPVYISYSHRDDEHPDLEEDVDALCQLMKEHHIKYLRDSEDNPYRANIDKFEQEIGQGKAVIVVASDKYYQSLHSMTEWHYLLNKNDIEKRVFMILLDDNIKNKAKRAEYRKNLTEQYKDAKSEHKKCDDENREQGSLATITQNVCKYKGYVGDFDKLHKYICDCNRGKGLKSLRNNNYVEIIEPLKKYLSELSEPYRLKKENPILKEEIATLKAGKTVLEKQIESLKCRINVFDIADGISFRMIRIDGGTINIPTGEKILNSYCIGETQVTQEVWEQVMEFNDSMSARGNNYPIDNISWFDAVLFCNKLSEKFEKEKVYLIQDDLGNNIEEVGVTIKKAKVTIDNNKRGFRLLTVDEWKYAAQCGKDEKFTYSGSNTVDYVAWYDKNSGGTTHEVKSKCCNEFGIYDM